MTTMNRLFTEDNRTVFRYYLIAEIAVIIWLCLGRYPVIQIFMLPFFRILDRHRRRLMPKVYSALPILPFLILPLLAKWTAPLLPLVPIGLYFLTLHNIRRMEAEMIEKGENDESVQ